MLIPGAGQRMAREFAEYRPWRSWAQFDKEIGKYVGADETARLAQYGFIPVKLNTASDADIFSIPGAGQRMVREFKEYRPWRTRPSSEQEIGKYVGPKESTRLWRYVVIHDAHARIRADGQAEINSPAWGRHPAVGGRWETLRRCALATEYRRCSFKPRPALNL